MTRCPGDDGKKPEVYITDNYEYKSKETWDESICQKEKSIAEERKLLSKYTLDEKK